MPNWMYVNPQYITFFYLTIVQFEPLNCFKINFKGQVVPWGLPGHRQTPSVRGDTPPPPPMFVNAVKWLFFFFKHLSY